MRKLETQLGTRIFRKNGRKLDLNPAGELLLQYSRRLLALNEEAVEATTAFDVHGSIRVGLLQDFAETVLPGVLSTFANAHPLAETAIVVERSPNLIGKLTRGELDLVLFFDSGNVSLEFIRTKIATVPMYWIFSPTYKTGKTLSLIFLEPPCVFREAALKNVGPHQAWRQTLSTPSLSGIWAAVEAGLGISVRTKLGIPGDLVAARRLPGKANLPHVDVILLQRENTGPLVARFREALLKKLADHLLLERRESRIHQLGNQRAIGAILS
jgi:DNA-binding transcriptional LysR family regulator